MTRQEPASAPISAEGDRESPETANGRVRPHAASPRVGSAPPTPGEESERRRDELRPSPTDDREELALLLWAAIGGPRHPWRECLDLADRIRAAGFHR